MSGILYVVGTPIGNLGDISPRAAKAFEECDFIAAEDTRVTVKLLNHLGLKKPMMSYFEHNKRERGGEILQRILNGENCVLVSDAGMPAISDPGEELVSICHEKGVKVCAVPGPTAFATAVAVSGLPTGRFTFEGFLSVNKKSRREHLEEIVNETRTMVFYEAPHKLSATLKDMAQVLGDRRIAIVREITKIHEEVIRTTLKKAAEDYANGEIKGEIVLVIEGAKKQKLRWTLADAVQIAKDYMEKGEAVSGAARLAARDTGIKKGEIYKALQEE